MSVLTPLNPSGKRRPGKAEFPRLHQSLDGLMKPQLEVRGITSVGTS
jgi:hypothetical protein